MCNSRQMKRRLMHLVTALNYSSTYTPVINIDWSELLIYLNSLSENNLFCMSILLYKKVIVSNYNWRFETSIIKQTWFDHKYSVYWLIVNDNDQGLVSLCVLFLFSYLLFETRQDIKKERVDKIYGLNWLGKKTRNHFTSKFIHCTSLIKYDATVQWNKS